MAQPPTVTHIPIAKPKNSERPSVEVATERTTNARTNVNKNSATRASVHDDSAGF